LIANTERLSEAIREQATSLREGVPYLVISFIARRAILSGRAT
jgi:hypothetical protein